MHHDGPFYNWMMTVCLWALPAEFSANIISTISAVGSVRNLPLYILQTNVHFASSGGDAS